MNIFKFSIVWFIILGVIFHHFGFDAPALISFESSGIFFLMYLADKSENK